MTAKIQIPEKDVCLTDVALALVHADDIQLPVLPEVAVQLLKLTADVDCDPKDIVNLFKRDQSLTGHLLRIANSARYNSGQSVVSIQQAVARLGLLQVREIVMLISCKATVFNVKGFEQDVRQSFETSLVTAAFAQEIARVRRLNVEDAFLNGLLHDVGRCALLQGLHDYRQDSDIEFTDDQVREAAESARVAMTCRLIDSWELPSRISQTVRHQQTPIEADEHDLQAAILNIAIDIADLCLDANREVPDQLIHPMMDLLNLYPEDVASVLQQHESILNWAGSAS